MKIKTGYLTTVQVAILPYLEAGMTQAEAARAVSADIGILIRQQYVSMMIKYNPYFRRLVSNISYSLGNWGDATRQHKAEALKLMLAEDINQTECSIRLGFHVSQFSRWKKADEGWAAQIDAAKSMWLLRRLEEEEEYDDDDDTAKILEA